MDSANHGFYTAKADLSGISMSTTATVKGSRIGTRNCLDGRAFPSRMRQTLAIFLGT